MFSNCANLEILKSQLCLNNYKNVVDCNVLKMQSVTSNLLVPRFPEFLSKYSNNMLKTIVTVCWSDISEIFYILE